jgi:hypothetical protein
MMKIEVIKDKKPLYNSRPWIVLVDGRNISWKGHKTKKEAIEMIEATGNVIVNK